MASAPAQNIWAPAQNNWAGKRAFRVGRGVCAPAQPIWAGKRSLLKWDECLQQPQLTRRNQVAQRNAYVLGGRVAQTLCSGFTREALLSPVILAVDDHSLRPR